MQNKTTITISNSDLPEFVGQFIDLFNDFLEEKEITHGDLGNHEQEEPWTPEEDVSAVIYGSQYDELAEGILGILNRWQSTAQNN